jgi:hypothetical protein
MVIKFPDGVELFRHRSLIVTNATGRFARAAVVLD